MDRGFPDANLRYILLSLALFFVGTAGVFCVATPSSCS